MEEVYEQRKSYAQMKVVVFFFLTLLPLKNLGFLMEFGALNRKAPGGLSETFPPSGASQNFHGAELWPKKQQKLTSLLWSINEYYILSVVVKIFVRILNFSKV